MEYSWSAYTAAFGRAQMRIIINCTQEKRLPVAGGPPVYMRIILILNVSGHSLRIRKESTGFQPRCRRCSNHNVIPLPTNTVGSRPERNTGIRQGQPNPSPAYVIAVLEVGA
jgi:hypothetical protein